LEGLCPSKYQWHLESRFRAQGQFPAVQGAVAPWRGGLEGQRPSSLRPTCAMMFRITHKPPGISA